MDTEKIAYNVLREEFGSKHIPYAQLLGTLEWANKREVIVKRDCEYCVKCKRGPSIGRANKNEYFGLGLVEHRDSNPCFPVVDIEVMYWSDKQYHMQVHHRFYILGRLPWDYPDDALITLCNWCHQEVHDTTVIPVLNHVGEALGYTPCNRCNGSGSFPEYSHVQSGECFKCNGARYEELLDK